MIRQFFSFLRNKGCSTEFRTTLVGVTVLPVLGFNLFTQSASAIKDDPAMKYGAIGGAVVAIVTGVSPMLLIPISLACGAFFYTSSPQFVSSQGEREGDALDMPGFMEKYNDKILKIGAIVLLMCWLMLGLSLLWTASCVTVMAAGLKGIQLVCTKNEGAKFLELCANIWKDSVDATVETCSNFDEEVEISNTPSKEGQAVGQDHKTSNICALAAFDEADLEFLKALYLDSNQTFDQTFSQTLLCAPSEAAAKERSTYDAVSAKIQNPQNGNMRSLKFTSEEVGSLRITLVQNQDLSSKLIRDPKVQIDIHPYVQKLENMIPSFIPSLSGQSGNDKAPCLPSIGSVTRLD